MIYNDVTTLSPPDWLIEKVKPRESFLLARPIYTAGPSSITLIAAIPISAEQYKQLSSTIGDSLKLERLDRFRFKFATEYCKKMNWPPDWYLLTKAQRAELAALPQWTNPTDEDQEE